MVARLCNGARFENSAEAAMLPADKRPVKGDATDTAVLRFSDSLPGMDAETLLASHEKVFEIPFNSRNKWMLTLVRGRVSGNEQESDPELCILVKGAPDVLFPACTHVLDANGASHMLDDNRRTQLHSLQAEWSSQGQRVLALCRRSLAKEPVKLDFAHMNPNDIEEAMYAEMQDLTLVGLIGIRDPPRHDVKDALAIIRRAGVRIFMVTGDFKLTALAIARQVRNNILYFMCNTDFIHVDRDYHPREG